MKEKKIKEERTSTGIYSYQSPSVVTPRNVSEFPTVSVGDESKPLDLSKKAESTDMYKTIAPNTTTPSISNILHNGMPRGSASGNFDNLINNLNILRQRMALMRSSNRSDESTKAVDSPQESINGESEDNYESDNNLSDSDDDTMEIEADPILAECVDQDEESVNVKVINIKTNDPCEIFETNDDEDENDAKKENIQVININTSDVTPPPPLKLIKPPLSPTSQEVIKPSSSPPTSQPDHEQPANQDYLDNIRNMAKRLGLMS